MRWENCSGCHRYDTTWIHGCLSLEHNRQSRCTGQNKHWRQSWDSCMLTCMHACVCRAGMRPSWGWWRPIEISSFSLFQRRITCAVSLQQTEGSRRWSCLLWEIFGKVTEPAAASFEFEFMWGRALWFAICVSRECCVWKIGSPSTFCTPWDRWARGSCDLVGEWF